MLPGRYSYAGAALLALPLYAGPLLAGWALHPRWILPCFAAIFLGYLLATRRISTMVELTVGVAVQLVLCGALIGLGRLGAGLGTLELPLWAPLGISVAGAALGAWIYRDGTAMEAVLDQALAQIEARDGSDPDPDSPPWSDDDQAALDRLLDGLDGLDADLPPAADVDALLAPLANQAGARAVDWLADETLEGDTRRDLAFLLYVQRPEILAALCATDEAQVLWWLLGAQHPGIRAGSRALLDRQLEQGLDPWHLPSVTWLDELEADHPGEGYAQRADRIATLRGNRD